jgi:anti-sigma regulatory factor (Ser/Thr protein kinase)
VTAYHERRDRPHELRLDLPAAHSAQRIARSLVRLFARNEGVTSEEIERIEFIASELLANAVDHGGGERAMEEEDRPGDVRMSLMLFIRPDGWELEVGDQGGGSLEEVQALIHPEGPPDLEDERGRGFFLLLGMLDSLTVVKSEDGRGLVFKAVRSNGTG